MAEELDQYDLSDMYDGQDNNDDYNNTDDNNYDYNDDDNQIMEPEINTMTAASVEDQLNNLNINNDAHLSLIYRRMVAGQTFRLPS